MNRFFKRQWYEPLFCKCINYFFRSILAVTKKIGYYRHNRQFLCDVLDNIHFEMDLLYSANA